MAKDNQNQVSVDEFVQLAKQVRTVLTGYIAYDPEDSSAVLYGRHSFDFPYISIPKDLVDWIELGHFHPCSRGKLGIGRMWYAHLALKKPQSPEGQVLQQLLDSMQAEEEIQGTLPTDCAEGQTNSGMRAIDGTQSGGSVMAESIEQVDPYSFSSGLIVQDFEEGITERTPTKTWYRESEHLNQLSLVNGCPAGPGSYYADRFIAYSDGRWEHSCFIKSNIQVFTLRIRYGNALAHPDGRWLAAGMTWRDGLGPGNCRNFRKSGHNQDIANNFASLHLRISDPSWWVFRI